MARSKEKSAAAAAATPSASVPAADKDIINKYQALCVSLATSANAAHQAAYAAHQFMAAKFPGIDLGEQNFFTSFGRPLPAFGGAPAAEEAGEDAGEDGQPAKRRKRTKNTTPKDPNAPKKPLTAYFAFAKVSRPEVVTELPNASNKEITEELATRWANMKDTGEQQPFRDQYAIEMKQYNKSLAAYKAKLGGLPVPEEVAEVEAEEEEEEPAPPPPKAVQTPRSAKGKKEKSESSKKKSKDKATPKEKSSRKRSTKEVTPPPSAGEEEQPALATKSPRKRKRKASD
ncbi:hypothetical protein TWF694_009577 [Orbilia ellipsospora]|uniref:HMG box domain-containing protein n=1 Tax=Orbilia ellipsospora TaxID=2528407 RepID=A0AAV9XEA6_9PEZI